MGTTQQPSAPARSIGTEHGYLIVAAIAASLAGLTVTLDTTTDEEFDLGIYVLLGTLFAVGVFGWLVRSEGAQQRQEHAEIRDLLVELTSRQRAPRRGVAHTYISQAARAATVGIVRPPVDAETVDAFERVNLRLLRGPEN